MLLSEHVQKIHSTCVLFLRRFIIFTFVLITLKYIIKPALIGNLIGFARGYCAEISQWIILGGILFLHCKQPISAARKIIFRWPLFANQWLLHLLRVEWHITDLWRRNCALIWMVINPFWLCTKNKIKGNIAWGLNRH